MRKLLACLLAGQLAGCALTPADLRERGVHDTTHTALPPERAAHCMQRNIENIGGAITARLGVMNDGGYELIARNEVDGVFEIYELRVEPRYGLTRIDAWLAHYVRNTPSQEAQALLRGC